jgi:hypothetical protein
MSEKEKAVRVISVCTRCGESTEIFLTKKQVKAIFKSFKEPTVERAEACAEKAMLKTMNNNKPGVLKPW